LNRIEAIYSFIDENDRVVDVGCDQAKLALMLSKRGQSSIASDISEKVIQKAKENIHSDLIDLRVSDGLSNIKEGEADTLVLSGMGTHTIIDILSNTKLVFNKIITISNNYHDILRTKMNDLNYKVDSEQIIKENNKYYNLIVFVRGKKDYSDYEINFGLNHRDKKLYQEYLDMLKNKYLKIKNTSNGKNPKIDKLLDLLK
jgi:tRNA (adenine22-N1)-methyltransferase